MGLRSKIAWLLDPYLGIQGGTVNGWLGCERQSEECSNCYISRTAALRTRKLQFSKAGIGGRTDIIFTSRKTRLAPLSEREPMMWFVESLGDLWDGRVGIRQTADMYAMMLLGSWHIFITCTKRTKRMQTWLVHPRFRRLVAEAVENLIAERRFTDIQIAAARAHLAQEGPDGALVPPPNVWVGTTVGNNRTAAERMDLLLQTPAALRWVSAEPVTNEHGDDGDEYGGPLNLSRWLPPRVPMPPEHAPQSWEDWTWPDWVPADAREQIREFWTGHGGPKRWLQAAIDNGAPVFGQMWTTPPEMRPMRAKGPFHGRFIYAWGNVGRLCHDDGTMGYTSFSAVSVSQQRPIGWVVLGGESGPPAAATELDTEPAVGLRPVCLTNMARLIDQVTINGAAVFVKQLGTIWAKDNGAHDPKGEDPDEWPQWLRVRQYPPPLQWRAVRHKAALRAQEIAALRAASRAAVHA